MLSVLLAEEIATPNARYDDDNVLLARARLLIFIAFV